MILLLCAISGFSMSPNLYDLLETSSIYSWTIESLLEWPTRITRDGIPLILLGEEPIPGWGSFDSIRLRSPLEAGAWAGGEWQLEFTTPDVPDSSYDSGIGLLQNTSSMNRYSAFVRRPVPWDLDLRFSMDREDTLKNQSVSLTRDAFEAGGRAWQNTGRAHSFWFSWSGEEYLGRLSFSRLHQGGRQWELLGSLETAAGPVDVMAGAAGTLAEDSMVYGEGHLRLESSFSGVRIIGRADVQDTRGDVEVGGTLGLVTSYGPFAIQAGAIALPGKDPEFMCLTGYGPLQGVISTGPDGLSGGLQTLLHTRWGLGRAGAALRGDTLRFSGMLLPSLPWGANGRFHAGMAWELTHEMTGERTYGTADIRSLFTLGRFAFIFAVEDVLDDYRSYTFGITWKFGDHPPRRPAEEGQEE